MTKGQFLNLLFLPFFGVLVLSKLEPLLDEITLVKIYAIAANFIPLKSLKPETMSKTDGINSTSVLRSRQHLKRKLKDSNVAQPLKGKRTKTQTSKVPEKNGEVKQATSLADLPTEILFKILDNFSFADLLKLERVNKRHQDVLKRVVWSTKHTLNHETIIEHTNYPKLSINELKDKDERLHKITNKSVKTILSRAHVLYLDVSIYYSTVSNKICKLLSLAPQLLVLNLSYIKLDKEDLFHIAKYCPFLEEVSFEDSFDEGEECDEGLKRIFTKCPNFKYLNIAKCCPLIGKSFSKIPDDLRFINLTSCFELTPRAFKQISEKATNLETLILNDLENVPSLNGFLNKFSNLKFLEISNIQVLGGKPALDFSNMKQLEGLNIKDSEYITANMLQSLQKCPKLRILELSLNHSSNIDVFGNLIKCKALRYFKLGWCKNVNKLVEFVQSCKIEYLAMFQCGDISEEMVKSLLTQCVSLSHLEILNALGFNYTSISAIISEDCPQRKNNILKFVIYGPENEDDEGDEDDNDDDRRISLPTSKWCEIVPIKYEDDEYKDYDEDEDEEDPSPFAHLFDVKLQYHK